MVIFNRNFTDLFNGKFRVCTKPYELKLSGRRIAVLVPAHNEAAGIGATLETLLPQLSEQDRLVVIADNCTDDTAAIAGHTTVFCPEALVTGRLPQQDLAAALPFCQWVLTTDH